MLINIYFMEGHIWHISDHCSKGWYWHKNCTESKKSLFALLHELYVNGIEDLKSWVGLVD